MMEETDVGVKAAIMKDPDGKFFVIPEVEMKKPEYSQCESVQILTMLSASLAYLQRNTDVMQETLRSYVTGSQRIAENREIYRNEIAAAAEYKGGLVAGIQK